MAEAWDVECDVLPGMEAILARELRRCFRGRVGELADTDRASLRFAFQGPLADLLDLRTAHAAYLALAFGGRRPTALLGHQNLRALLDRINVIRALHPAGSICTFRFGAAGRETSTFRRLAADLEAQSGLRHDPDDGELLIRIRPPVGPSADGWEALLRLSPRPLSTRAWRVANYPGALNATIAAAMIELTAPRADDHFVNLMCGSGTLLVERLLRCPVAEALGVDISRDALDAARANLAAAGVGRRVKLMESDAVITGLDMARYTALTADLPYGNLVGSHRDNATLYPRLLAEAARMAAPGARFAVVTHEIRLLDASLAGSTGLWQLERTFRVFQGGQRPQVYLLRRR
jgi:tRNA (guanine6-N2)-methyltransferase